MIRSKSDYKRYLESDACALGRTHRYGLMDWLMDPIWTYERLLRKVEYLQNKTGGLFGQLWRRVVYFQLHRLAIKLGFSLGGRFGEGLSIAHYGPIVVSTKTTVGKNCRIHVGVNIGEGSDGKAPMIGDNCYLGPGAKLFGGIVIGDNVKIGANAVVNKSFPEGNCTLVGVPARKVDHGV